MQWMVLLCAGMYLVGFASLRCRRNEGNPRDCREKTQEAQRDCSIFWLLGLAAAAGFSYGLDYTQACKSTQVLTLLGTAMIGQAIRFTIYDSRFTREEQQRSKETKSETWLLLGVLVLLVVAAVWQPEAGRDYQYRNQTRWIGPWDNPNTFGGLMGAGMVLAVGMALRMGYKVQVTGCRLNRSAKWRKWLTCAFFVVMAGIIGFGLVKSYSRGAWVGTAVALAYLGYQVFGFSGFQEENHEIRGIREKQRQRTEAGQTTRGVSFCSRLFHLPRILRLPRFRLFSGSGVVWLAVVVVSLGTLVFWAQRDSEWLPARRAASVANANDFSWRNRVAAWEGALQMMAEKPWFGYGWNQPERIYDQFYRPSKLSEGAAIQLNDYFTLGTTLGIPALVCFVVYVGLCFGSGLRGAGYRLQVEQHPSGQTRISRIATNEPVRSRSTPHTSPLSSPVTRHPSIPQVCRAATLVLLVGFWFDGGLFKLATASTFWILLGLRRESRVTEEMELKQEYPAPGGYTDKHG